MTRKQKLILIILGVLDIAVITLLANVVIRSLSPTPAASPIVVQASPCEQRLIELAATTPPFTAGIPKVAWNNRQLTIALRVMYSTATPPKDSAQLLWTALDTLAKVVREGCALPETIIITIDAYAETETQQFLVQLAGADIKDWLAGVLSEEALAAQAHYRQTTVSH